MQGQLSRAAACSMCVDLPGAVVALDHHAAVVLEAGEDRERHLLVEEIVGVDVGNVLIGFGVGWHLEIGVDAEHLAHRHFQIRNAGQLGFSTRRGLRAHRRGPSRK